MLPPEKLRKADLVTAFLLILLGGSVIYGALRMPRGGAYGGVENAWYVSPGVFPLVIGALLIVCSLSVALHALKEGAGKDFFLSVKTGATKIGRDASFWRVAVICLWTAVLIFGFMERINFYVAGFVFLFVFMLMFHKRKEGIPHWRHFLFLFLLSLFVSSATSYLFDKHLLVPLP